MSANSSWKISFLKMKEILSNIIAACNFFKIAALPQVFFWQILKTVPKDFQIFSKFSLFISTSQSVLFNFMHTFIYISNLE